MSLGAVLVQPQRVRRKRTERQNTTLLVDFMSFITRIAVDRKQGGRIGEIAGDALLSAFERIANERAARIPQAGPHIVQVLGDVARALTGVSANVRISVPSDALAIARDLFDHFAIGLEGVTAAQIRPHVAALLGILENDLGFGFAQVEIELWSIVDDLIVRLEAAPPESDARARATRLEFACLLRRLRKELRGSFTLPRLDADRIASLIVKLLADVKSPGVAQKFRCVADALDAAVLTGQSIEELVPIGTFSEFRSLGAAAAAAEKKERYCWYASWLLNDDVVINEERTEIRKGGDVVATGEDLDLKDIPEFKSTSASHYTFGQKLDMEVMDTIAFVSAITADGLIVLLHLVSIEESDYLSNIFNLMFPAVLDIGKIHAHKTFMPGWAEDWLIPSLITVPTSFEGVHKAAEPFYYKFVMWLTLFAADFGEERLYRGYGKTGRNALLGTLTLKNHKKPEAGGTSPENYKTIAGLSDLIGLFTGMIVGLMIPKDDWGFNNTSTKDLNTKLIFGWWFTAATACALFGRIAGGFVCWAIAGERAPVGLWFTQRWWMLFEYWFWQIAFTYWRHDGDTDGGTYVVTPGAAKYAGFPDYKTSPYVLPYKAGDSRYVVQGNHGLFSHHKLNFNQIYAYDFSLDMGERVLAARPGTVVDYFDWVPDNTQQSTPGETALLVTGQTNNADVNYVVVRHDRDEMGVLLAVDKRDAHDKGVGNTDVRTYATYLHGRKGSVREAFKDRGIDPVDIIGQEVKRGDWIMRAGSTGVSAHNHLHIAVVPGDEVTTAPPVKRSSLGDELPFVFRDVDGGEPGKLNWYTAHPEKIGP